MRWKLSCRVGEITLCARRNSIVYPPRESNRDRLCGIIDTILAEQPKDFEVFLQKLIQQGYEVKRGKHTAAKGKEQKISSADELWERAAAATERYHAMGDSIKAAEARLTEIAVLKTHIINYAKTREVYAAYRKAGYSKVFLEAHREEIKAVLEGKAKHQPYQKQPPKEQPFQLLVDIQGKMAQGKSVGYKKWATKFNLK